MIPEDRKPVEGLLRHCYDKMLYSRYLNVLKSFPPSFLMRFTQNDYDRELGLAAIGLPPGLEVMMGVGRLIMIPELDTAEFAGIVADPWHAKGLGDKLIKEIIEIARDYGVKLLWGEILATNEPIPGLVRKSGFTVNPLEEGLRRMALVL